MALLLAPHGCSKRTANGNALRTGSIKLRCTAVVVVGRAATPRFITAKPFEVRVQAAAALEQYTRKATRLVQSAPQKLEQAAEEVPPPAEVRSAFLVEMGAQRLSETL